MVVGDRVTSVSPGAPGIKSSGITTLCAELGEVVRREQAVVCVAEHSAVRCIVHRVVREVAPNRVERDARLRRSQDTTDNTNSRI